ncbi:MAG TPA: response regulator [Lacunisphaera sp.]|jgi:PAS domain S-box-containing protein|nr:response regulator [Lacunisphaera sp.]
MSPSSPSLPEPDLRPLEPGKLATRRTPPVNILIVDDEVRNLDVLESILYAPGYRLVRATSANDALLALVDGEFAVLVLDINMPGMTGIELAHLIKQRKRTQHIPIVFLTAYYQDEKFVLEGYGVGAVDYLTKPVNPEILRAKVAVFVDLHRLNQSLATTNAALEKEVTQRTWAETALRQANEALESRVAERTRELTAANEALRSSEGQLRLVADHASVYLAHVDREHRFKFVNRAYAARFGLNPEEIVGADMSRIMGPAAYAACRQYLEHSLGGERVEFEVEATDERTGPHWMHIVYEPERSAAGEVSGVVAVIADITARKQAEQELERARDEAMAASRAKDDFLAALSHELRTPLSPVLLVASAAAANPALPDAVREDFACIAKNAQLEAKLIDDLLDLTRITRGKLTLELKPADVHAVLRDAIGTVRGELDEKKLELVTEFAAVHHAAIADSVRLQQVFWNVLKNAIKFTARAGRIRVETRSLTDANEMTVTVTDSGIGMTAEELGRVFHAFSQGDHANGAHRFGGLGLGLAISEMLMQLHGGSVQAFSPGRGKGSTFVIRIPLSAATMAAGTGAPDEEDEGDLAGGDRADRRPILLVEDHEATRVVLSNLLMRRRYAVLSTDTMAGALRLAATRQFDFVVSDLGLPDGNGYELMKLLRERHGLKGIALSGYGTEQDVFRSREAGFIGHLTKPVTFRALERVIQSVQAGLAASPARSKANINSDPPVAPNGHPPG